ncbi:hypothetical protein ACFLXI_00345 [Chloroflexota bacterium]
MTNQFLLYAGAAFVAFWGIAHLFPTKNIVAGFGDISEDNKNIITMEWIIEGVSMIFIGVLVTTVTLIDHTSPVSIAVFWITFGGLNILSAVALFTGFRVNFLPFKLCPLILTTASIMILLGVLL